MGKGRLEAFSDGVIAIIITIMVLELKAPIGTDIYTLLGLFPVFLSYVLSFIYISIYWNNHHHMLHTVKFVSGPILWANMHLLFWLSLIPFATSWVGQNFFGSGPTAFYGFIMLMSAIAYTILQVVIIKKQGKDSILAKAVAKDYKGKLSIFFYVTAIPLAFFNQAISGLLYVVVALMWLAPDKRIEKFFSQPEP